VTDFESQNSHSTNANFDQLCHITRCNTDVFKSDRTFSAVWSVRLVK